MRKKIAAVLCAAAAFLTMSGCKKAPPGTLTGISISYSGMCYDDTYGFSIRNDPADGCLFSCNYKDDEWVELEITDETLDSVCLIYKAPDDEIVYRYLDADGNTRSALRDFFEALAGQLQTEGKRGDA